VGDLMNSILGVDENTDTRPRSAANENATLTPSMLETEFKGIEGLATKLKTNLESGLKADPRRVEQNATGIFDDDLDARKEVFGANVLAKMPIKSIWVLMFEAAQDTTIYLLAGASAFALILEFSTAGECMEEAKAHGWIEPAAIFAAIVVVVLVTAITDKQKDKQFRELEKAQKRDQSCRVLRNGVEQQVPPESVVVGDVMVH
jgi:Ca2+-transporting ATPase